MLKTYFHKNIVWYDFLQPTEEKFLSFSEKLDIDPYIVKKILGKTNRDKALILGKHLFLSISIPDWQHDKFKKQEIKFIIGPEYIITSTNSKNEGLEFFKEKFEYDAHFKKSEEFENPVVYSLLHIFEKIYENIIFKLESVEKKINKIEENIFMGNEKYMVKRISETNRLLINFKRSIRNHEETWDIFLPLAKQFFERKQSHDAIDSIALSYQKAISEFNHLKEYLLELRDTNNSLLSGKLNDTSRTFTLIAFLTLPITLFISVISVTEIKQKILGTNNDFYIIISIILILFVTSLVFSKWKKWW